MVTFVSPILVLCETGEMCQGQPESSSGYPVGSTYIYDHRHIRNSEVALRDSSHKIVICFFFFFLLGKTILGFWMIGSVVIASHVWRKIKSGFSGDTAAGWKEVNKCFLKKHFFSFLSEQTFYHCLLNLRSLCIGTNSSACTCLSSWLAWPVAGISVTAYSV